MALLARSGARNSSDRELSLPPLFTAVRLREAGDAFAHAQTIAAESGAGTLVHVGRFDLAEFALVLEPEEPLRAARRAFYAGMTALADALAGRAEPETMINIAWPDAVFVNAGLVGGGRLAWPSDAGEDEVPPWLVFGAMIRVASTSGVEPGLNTSVTALEEEGFGTFAAQEPVEGFARHFMAIVDAWQESGFGAVARGYLPRLELGQSLHHAIDENGDLLVRGAAGGVERRPLIAALATPTWLDPQRGGPYG